MQRPRLSHLSLALVASASVLLAGCGVSNIAPASPAAGVDAAGAIHGNIHGGHQPVYNATVTLYEAGYTGYGTGSTALAQTTSDTGGNFSFTKNTGTGTPNTTLTNSYQCDSSTPTAQLYIVASGGNTQGTGVTTTNNIASGLMTAIGQCSNVSSSTQVILNELTTAATVYALAQYINPGTTPGTVKIGTSSSAQGTLGLNTAVSNIANLTNITEGSLTSIQAPTYKGTNPSVTGITVTATADYPKLIDVANILASCINNVSLTSTTTCADLFNNATPPAAGVTSQPSATFTAATDTIQAAYYLATNPGLTGTAPTCYNNSSSTTKSACLFGLITAASPYQTGTTTAPTDYTIGVNYTATGTCAGGSFISGPYHANVDANGNLWFINGATSNATIAEISPTGTPLFCGAGTFTAGAGGSGRGLTIDPAGNVWGSYNSATNGGIVEIPVGTATVNTIVNTPANPPYEMTSDGFGNVFYNVNAAGGSISEFIAGAAATTPTPVTVASGFNGTASTTQGYMQVDSNGRIWDATSTVSFIYGLYPTSTVSITATVTDGSKATFTTSTTPPSGFIPNAQVQISGLTSTLGTTYNGGTYTITAVGANSFSIASGRAASSGTETAGTAYIPGAYTFSANATPSSSYGIAIDSSNNIYQGTTCCSGATFKELLRETPTSATSTTTTTVASTNYLGGQNGIRSTVVDGASNVFTGSEFPNGPFGATAAGVSSGSFSIAEINYNNASSFVALSPTGVAPTTCSTSAGCATTGGYFDSNATEALPYDMQIDASGNLWVLDTGNYTTSTAGAAITEIVGVAVPVVTPLSMAVKNGQLGTKP